MKQLRVFCLLMVGLLVFGPGCKKKSETPVSNSGGEPPPSSTSPHDGTYGRSYDTHIWVSDSKVLAIHDNYVGCETIGHGFFPELVISSTGSINYIGTSFALVGNFKEFSGAQSFVGFMKSPCNPSGGTKVEKRISSEVRAVLYVSTFGVPGNPYDEPARGTGGVTLSNNGSQVVDTPFRLHMYPLGTSLNAMANPGPNSELDEWHDICSGTGDCSFTLNNYFTEVGAWFQPKQHTLILNIACDSGCVAGSYVTSSFYVKVNGVNKGFVFNYDPGESNTFKYNYDVNISIDPPTASSGATFVGWSGACTGMGTCSPTFTERVSVTAHFTRP